MFLLSHCAPGCPDAGLTPDSSVYIFVPRLPGPAPKPLTAGPGGPNDMISPVSPPAECVFLTCCDLLCVMVLNSSAASSLSQEGVAEERRKPEQSHHQGLV